MGTEWLRNLSTHGDVQQEELNEIVLVELQCTVSLSVIPFFLFVNIFLAHLSAVCLCESQHSKQVDQVRMQNP